MTGDKVENKTMAFSNLSDLEMAGKVRMLYRDQLDHEAICVGARDRIMFLSQEVERLKADVAYLADRASSAGQCGGRTPRDVGSSSNAIVALAYKGKPVNSLPADKWDYAACVLAVEKMPQHRKTPEVIDSLDRAREAVRL